MDAEVRCPARHREMSTIMQKEVRCHARDIERSMIPSSREAMCSRLRGNKERNKRSLTLSTSSYQLEKI